MILILSSNTSFTSYTCNSDNNIQKSVINVGHNSNISINVIMLMNESFSITELDNMGINKNTQQTN
jgi:hypothetical protein